MTALLRVIIVGAEPPRLQNSWDAADWIRVDLKDDPIHFLARFLELRTPVGPVTIERFARILAVAPMSFVLVNWKNRTDSWKDVIDIITKSPSVLRLDIDVFDFLPGHMDEDIKQWLGTEFEVSSPLKKSPNCRESSTEDDEDAQARKLAGCHNGIYRFAKHNLRASNPTQLLKSDMLYSLMKRDASFRELYGELPPDALQILRKMPTKASDFAGRQRLVLSRLVQIGICRLDDRGKYVCFSPLFQEYVRIRSRNRLLTSLRTSVIAVRDIFRRITAEQSITQVQFYAPLGLLLLNIALFSISFPLFFFVSLVSGWWIAFNLKRMRQKDYRANSRKVYAVLGVALSLLSVAWLINYWHGSKEVKGNYQDWQVLIAHKFWISRGDTHTNQEIELRCLSVENCLDLPENLESFGITSNLVVMKLNTPEQPIKTLWQQSFELEWPPSHKGGCPSLSEPASAQIYVGDSKNPVLSSEIDLFPQNIPIIGACLEEFPFFFDVSGGPFGPFSAFLVALLLQMTPYGFIYRYVVTDDAAKSH